MPALRREQDDPLDAARDPKRVGLLRTWVCTACQLVEERAEAED